MKSRRNRSLIRSLRSHAGKAREAHRETHFEALEERKLLFSITITPDMDGDGDGIGQARAVWGYTVPVLDSDAEIEDSESEDVTEDFNDEGVGPFPSGGRLTDSEIRVTHNFGFSQNFRIDPPGVDIDERYLQINASNGSFWLFEPTVVDDNSGQVFEIAASQVTFTISDPTDNRGLLPNDFFVDLLFYDEVIDTFTAQELFDANQSGSNLDRQRGIGTFILTAADASLEAFTGVRFRSTVSENLRLDDLAFTIPQGEFTEIVESRIFGAELVFSAPIGATVQVLDLYGRDMVQTLALGIPDGLDIPLVDLDGDGVPNYNDGIGQIRLSGVDARASVTVFGGTVEFGDTGFEYTRVDNLLGLYDDFEQAGFGYLVEYDDSGTPSVYGLPAGPGSVVFGSPFVRNNNSGDTYSAAGRATNATSIITNFNRADQGVFVTDGQSMGSVYIHGVVHGSSRFSGAVEDLYFGYLVGTVTVEGDVGTMYVGADAGMWVSDDDAVLDFSTDTGAQLSVGRTLGELAVGGRSELNVTVAGDLSNPALRPPADSLRYREREGIFGIPADSAQDIEPAIIGNILFASDFFGQIFAGPGGRSPIFNDTVLRNDTLMGAEFVGSISTAAQVRGTVGFGDPLNGEDAVDVFAFAADGTQDIAIQVNTLGAEGLVRVFDQNGRPLASTDLRLTLTTGSQSLVFHPPHAGVFYIEISDLGIGLVDGTFEGGWRYALTLAGLAPVTLGSYRTAGSSGWGALPIPTVQTITGSIGALRVGVTFTGADGTDQTPTGIMNRPGDEELEDSIDMIGTTFSTPGNLYSLIAGSDIQLGDLYVGGDMGEMYVGMSPVVGLTADGRNGDVYGFRMQVGGRIANIDIKGAVGIDQDTDPITYILGIGADITTGVGGGDGSIGMIRIGGDVNGGTLLVNTAPGSTIGGLLISQDREDDFADELGIYNDALDGTDINTGFGGDIRFVDFPKIDIGRSLDHHFDLRIGQPVEFVDDGGGIVRIEVSGPTGAGTLVGAVRVLPMDNGQGVAIARIDSDGGAGLDLSGGRSLRITGVGRIGGGGGSSGGAPISIGRIDIAAADATSDIIIDGLIEVDVWQIVSAAALDQIVNRTPNGDIVAIDVAGLANLDIFDGHLGRTETVEYGPDRIGPFLDIAVGEQSAVGGALGVSEAALVAQPGGATRPIGDASPATIYLTDMGAPLDPFLNGLVVRAGNVNRVTVSRSIGDIILQGGGELVSVVADSDFLPSDDGVDGIFGNVYAQNINSVDVGEGLVAGGRAPFAGSGIFATDELRTVSVNGLLHQGAFIGGIVMAADITDNPRANGEAEIGGIGAIDVTSGMIREAYIGAMSLDAFLVGYLGITELYVGTIGSIRGTDVTIFRSDIEAWFVNEISLPDGVYDATTLNIGRDLQTIEVQTIRNTTLTGGDFEYHENFMYVARNAVSFEASEVSDLRFEAVGRFTGLVTSDTWRRVEWLVSGSIASIEITDTLVSSKISVGELTSLTANAIRTSQVLVSGELGEVEALTEIYNSEFSVTGTGGEIGSITAVERITGAISASGPIGSIEVTGGDLIAAITTTTGRGTVGSIAATRDVILDTDISVGLGSLDAGRNLGAPGAAGMILVRGDLASATAGGHLYTDLRVGGVLESVQIGGAVNRPGAPMALSGSIFGAQRIESVVIGGDYGGRIVSYTNGIGSLVINNGSLLATGAVSAHDGDVESVVINAGNLYGDIYSSRDILSVQVNASADGIFGDIGVNPFLSAGVAYDGARGQLPPGTLQSAGKDGPVITADRNIESVVVSGGAVFEATIYAGRTLRAVQVSRDVRSDITPGNIGRSVLAAGDTVESIVVGGNMDLAQIMAGVRSLGDDMAAGGFGENSDTTQSGDIVAVSVAGAMTNTQITAGMNAGSDREYNTGDDKLEIGSSSVGPVSVGGSVAGSSVYSDTLLAGSTAGGRLAWGGPFRPVNHPDIPAATTGTPITAGSNFSFSSSAGEGTIVFTGPGSAFFDAANSRVILHRTTSASSLVVRAGGNHFLDGFDIVSTEGASVGTIRVEAYRILGDSDIVIDENVGAIQLGELWGQGDIVVGDTLTSFFNGVFVSGTLSARTAGSVVVTSRFGDADPDVRGEAMMSFVTAGAVRFGGPMRGALHARYSLDTVTMNGALDNGLVHAGDSIGAITAATVTESRISAGNSLASLAVAGDMFDSSVMIGGDLGDDAEVSGSGFAADAVGAGTIGSVTVGGDMTISDIVAGYLRGPDGFFGTGDDLLASGRSSIGSVAVGGEIVGSNKGSESYLIAATGLIGPVTEGGNPANNDQNLIITEEPLDPLPIRIEDVVVSRDGREVVATLFLNSGVDSSSLTRALSVSEVRGLGEIEIRLIEGIDYTTTYNPADHTVAIAFSNTVSERNLPVLADEPGPGIYRFTLLSDEVRGRAALADLDGDGDGAITEGDDYSADDIIGDLGDAFSPTVFTVPPQNGFPAAQVDLFPPVNLDIVLDDNFSQDGLPDANTEFTVRGSIGDHPDHNPNYFSFASDSDLYAITLQAGQILRLGAMQGAAQFTGRFVIQPDGALLLGSSDYGLALPLEPFTTENRDFTFDEDFLIRQTGVYHIYLGNAVLFVGSGILPDLDPIAGGVGDYAFTLEVFDDGDTGFNAETDAGDGQDLVNAPAPGAFAGDDGTLGTADDVKVIVNGPYRFTFDAGPDGAAGTLDDFVTGTNGSNVTSVTNALGTKMVAVEAAIGHTGSIGLPTNYSPDIDIFHLNAGNTIPTGSIVRATLKLDELGTDLGSRVGNLADPVALANLVKFSIFDTTTATGSDDALLVFSPSDVLPTSGEPGVIADGDNVTYGFDENGDFFIEFVAPGRQDLPGAAASYAIYVQGVLNSDYRLEVVTAGSREMVKRKQNILIETGGGSVDWLEVGGVTTPIGQFLASSMGFTGRAANGQTVHDYIIDGVIETMQDMFDSIVTGAGPDGRFGTADDIRGLDINVSADPADFEFQDYSTIFLSTSLDPLQPILSLDFGVSQHVDPGNADRNDEAIIFLPAYTILGYTPSTDDMESFIQSLAAGASRRAGELMGLRFTEAYDPAADLFDVVGVNSVENVPGDAGEYEFASTARRLSSPNDDSEDSDFFLGYQNSASLLSLYIRS